jgi:hypothetical protein
LARDNRKDVKKVSDNLVGFKLADGYEDFSGGTLTYGASQVMFDVGKALRESEDQLIVVADPYLIEALRDYDALTEAQGIPEGATPVAAPGGVQFRDLGERPAPVGYIPQSGALPEGETTEDSGVEEEQEATVEAQQTPPGGEQTLEQRMAAANAAAEHADEDDDDSGISSGR